MTAPSWSRETVMGNAYVAATRWNRVATVATSVLRRTPGGLTFSLAPSSYRVGEEGGTRGAGTKE
jgi:hypothetical protein